MSSCSKCKIALLIFAGIIVIFFAAFFVYQNKVNTSSYSGGEQVTFEIKKGESLKEIGQRLEQKGVIDSSFFFAFHGWFTDKGKKIKAGEYALSPVMSIKEVVNKLAQGEVVERVDTLKIVEGWNLKEIADYLEEKGVTGKEEFLAVTGYPQGIHGQQPSMPADPPGEHLFLQSKPAEHSLEGYLFPDTYEVYKDASAEEIAAKMLNNFDAHVTEEMIRDAQEKGRSLHRIVTMASLLEKEVKTKEEMKIVSGIFWDRIENERPLQSCATLAYILGENKTVYTGRDTQVESPYNTYKYKGLPPAPVSNPGIKAIEAAIYPIESDHQYFLSPVGSDKTLFSETLREHQRKKQKYID